MTRNPCKAHTRDHARRNNVCDNLLRTIIGEKNSFVVQHDMKDINIHPEL